MLPPIARRFVAGESLPAALDHARARNEAGIGVILNLLGEHHDDPADVRAAVDEAYRRDVEFPFERRDRGVAVGRHDPAMVSLATRLGPELGTDYEIRMLMGVREDAQRDLARQGVEVNQYAPYGDAWLPYFYRRVRERRENLTFALRAVVGR